MVQMNSFSISIALCPATYNEYIFGGEITEHFVCVFVRAVRPFVLL